MTLDLQLLAWTLALAIIYIAAPATARTLQYGAKWNAGARDKDVPPPTVIAGRLARAQANLFETLPLFVGAVLVAHVGGADAALTVLGAQLYLGSRIVYLPLYAFGVPYLRTLTWLVGLAGIVTILYAILAQ
ncbi:MAG: MAPEG family protein [Alphaproteobacteria bacterium]